MESRIENPPYSFRETNLVLQLIKELQIKSKTVIVGTRKKKKDGIFCTIYFVRRNFICFISMSSVLNILNVHTNIKSTNSKY